MKKYAQRIQHAPGVTHFFRANWVSTMAFIFLPIFAVFCQEVSPGQQIGKSRTILSAKSVWVDIGVVNYQCLESVNCFFWPLECCLLADSTAPVGPAYRFYQMGIENWIISSTRSYAYVLGVDIQVEHFRNRSLPYDGFRGNLHAFFGMEGNKIFGFRGGLRIGQSYRNDNYEKITKLALTGRMWFGSRPIAVIQVGFLDNPVVGISVSTFYSLLDINASRLHRKYLGRFRAGISSVYDNAIYWFGDMEVKPFKNLILVPTVTNIPKTAMGTSEVGFGLGVKYIIE